MQRRDAARRLDRDVDAEIADLGGKLPIPADDPVAFGPLPLRVIRSGRSGQPPDRQPDVAGRGIKRGVRAERAGEGAPVRGPIAGSS